MTKEKQIEEMARAINVADHEYCNGKCIGCEHKSMRIEDCACVDIAIAKGLYDAGYRKTSDIAREIFEEIRTQMREKVAINEGMAKTFPYDADFYKGSAELKKKYTE